ncbi:MAG: tetratricopeptide repeat protein, partial [Candidatus Omnitrophica bacterium]|nr:tetratricopeptide repeat protein [Candidatus Omnitrophota bacterium]
MSRCNFRGARRFWRKETSLILVVLFLVFGVSSRGFCAEDDKNDIDDGCLTRAIQYTMKGDLDSAIAEYGVAIFLNPKCSLAYYNRAKLYEYKGSYEQAVIDYGNAIACDPAYEQAYYYRGIVYQTCGMHELAIADYSKVLEISDNKRIKANAHNNLGLAYQAKGKPDKALVEFGKALDLIPDLVNAHYNRALAR